MNLTKEDYIKILNYYNVSFKKTTTSYVKKLAEQIIAKKLCSCIKKVPNANNPESRAIGICSYSVLQKKHLKINGFTCKKKMRLKSSKNNKHKLFKDISQLLLKNNTTKKLRKL
jgi:hypothetical protein